LHWLEAPADHLHQAGARVRSFERNRLARQSRPQFNGITSDAMAVNLESTNSRGSTFMLNQQLLDEMSAKVRELLAKTPARDIEANMRAMLASMFSKLDLVTRHEFDIQTEVLARTREKLAELESKLAALDKTDRT
jgi:BMFP domain-containing protein YqiC